MALLDAYMDSATEKGIPGIYVYPVSSRLSYQLPHDFASLHNVPLRTELLMPQQQPLRRKHRLNPATCQTASMPRSVRKVLFLFFPDVQSFLSLGSLSLAICRALLLVTGALFLLQT